MTSLSALRYDWNSSGGDHLVADAEDSAEGAPLNGQERFVVVSGGVGSEEVFGALIASTLTRSSRRGARMM